MNIQRLSLDLAKRTGNQQVTIAQGDFEGTTIVAPIYDNGTLLAETGITAHFLMALPDGEHYVRDEANYEDGVVTYVVNEEYAASVAGYTDNAYFELRKGDQIVSTERFAVIVEPCAYDDLLPGETYDTEIQEAIDNLNEAVEGIPDVVETVLEDHPEWTTTVQDGSITGLKLHSSLMGRLTANVPTGNLAEGSVLVADDAAATPLRGATVYGTSTQDGTPTPSAPVAIESVTSAELRLSGQSIWGGSAMHDDVHAVIPAATDGTNEHGSYVLFSGSQASGKRLFEGAFKPDTRYTFILSVGKNNTSGNTNLRIYYTDGTYSTINRTSTDSDGTPDTFALVSTGGKTVEVLRGSNSSGNTYLYYDQCAVLEGVHTAGDFAPYVGTTTPIDLDGHELRSLPDGTRDELVISSDGSVTLVQRVGSITFDGTEDWSVSSGRAYGTYTGLQGVIQIPATTSTYANARCSICGIDISQNKGLGNDSVYNTVGIAVGSTGSVFLNLTGETATTAAELKAALAAQNAVFVYELAEPVTIALPSVTMPTAPSPEMTAWATSSPSTTLTITYERDINMALVAARDEAMAAIADPDGPTATATHAVGTYLTMGGKLYRVTTAIAIGESITPGTNVTATTVMAEVLSLVQ